MRGDLYVAGRSRGRGRGRGREHSFPAWQFTDAGPLPELRAVLAAMPEDYHPLDVASVMTSPHESLGDRSPADWLAGGGDPSLVVALVDELGWVVTAKNPRAGIGR